MEGNQRDELLDGLRARIREVRERIVDMVAQMEDIRLQQLPQVRIEYEIKIGCWEKALLEAELEARRLKRKLALVQAHVNRGEAVDEHEIDEGLDQEFAEWQRRLAAACAALEQAMEARMDRTPMAPAEAREFKRLYRLLVKRLHPDVSHGAGDGGELFQLARRAYERGDVEALRALEVATRHLQSEDDDLDATTDEAALGQELELAQIEEEAVRSRLQELESCEELQLRERLQDPEWVTQRTTELRRQTEEWERVSRECKRRLESLREGWQDGRL